MREILFRAKRLDNGEWVEGYVFDDGFIDSTRRFIGNIIISDYKGNADDKWEILGTDFYEVNPETICQFTGLTDKNGKKIFENDVIEEDWGNYKGIVRFGKFESLVLKNVGFNIEWHGGVYYRQDLMYWGDKCEVIGSAIDNPELLKGGSE